MIADPVLRLTLVSRNPTDPPDDLALKTLGPENLIKQNLDVVLTQRAG